MDQLSWKRRHPLLTFFLELIAAVIVVTCVRMVLLYFAKVNPFHILDGDW